MITVLKFIQRMDRNMVVSTSKLLPALYIQIPMYVKYNMYIYTLISKYMYYTVLHQALPCIILSLAGLTIIAIMISFMLKFICITTYVPSYEKTCFLHMRFAYAKTKAQISCVVTTQLISAFVFSTQIERTLYFLDPKFPASSHLL